MTEYSPAKTIHYLFVEAYSFPPRALHGTDYVRAQLFWYIFAPNGGYCLLIDEVFVISRNHAPWWYITWLSRILSVPDIIIILSAAGRQKRRFRKFTVRFRPIRKEIVSSMHDNSNNTCVVQPLCHVSPQNEKSAKCLRRCTPNNLSKTIRRYSKIPKLPDDMTNILES